MEGLVHILNTKKNNISIKNKDKLDEIDLKTALELLDSKKKK